MDSLLRFFGLWKSGKAPTQPAWEPGAAGVACRLPGLLALAELNNQGYRQKGAFHKGGTRMSCRFCAVGLRVQGAQPARAGAALSCAPILGRMAVSFSIITILASANGRLNPQVLQIRHRAPDSHDGVDAIVQFPLGRGLWEGRR